MRRLVCALAAGLTLAGLAVGTTGLPAQAREQHTTSQSTRTYLVALRQAPAASYSGGLAGYPATAPAPGKRFDDGRPAVATYRSYLLSTQARLLAKLGDPTTLYSYTTALNGFAADLTFAQVKTLQSTPGVQLVEPDSVVRVDSTDQRGAGQAERAPTRLWDQVGGPAHAGRSIVVGVIDTGVDPDNPSLAGIPLGSSTLAREYPGFTGSCEAGVRWTASTCTSKVLAAQYFVRGFGVSNVAEADYLSPRDSSGHGTSVASIAAGNSGIDTRIAGQDFGHITGMAPAAGLSIYKACWSAPDPGNDGCDLADAVKAIDQAVEDGVDVINFSIGGMAASLDDAVELAFLNATAAHVFVAASAGNGGPLAGSVQHPSPWVTTVGANTHDVFQGGVKLGNGATYVGAMLSDQSVGTRPLVYAGDAPAAGVAPHRAALCYPGSLDAQRVDGAIVVCDRGVTPRVSKSAAVAQSGGSAMVLVNTQHGSIDADLHAVPTVHLDVAAGQAVKTYIAHAGRSATGSILAAATDNPPVPEVAGFSGRGPSTVADGDLLKPDLTAPGVSVVAAVAPDAGSGQLWNVQSGTSIAAAHVAGVAAVVRGAHPSWSPATVKSAMMTTALPLKGAASPLDRGAGELDPASVLRPGLVYDSGPADYSRLLGGDLDASQLNQPSISVGDLISSESVSRTVTNVGTSTDTYTAALQGLRGIAGSIDPATLTVAPGRSASFTVTFGATKSAAYDEFTTGSLTWRDNHGSTVTSPVAIRPELASVPAEVTSSGRTGTADVKASAGVTGTIRATTSGLVGATPIRLTLHPAAFDPAHPAASSGTSVQAFTVPSGARAARFQVSSTERGDDVDLYVYRAGRLIDSATDRSADETMTLTAPPAGSYRVYVNAHRAATGDTTTATFTSWVLPQADQHNLVLTPARQGVNGGEPFVVGAHWSGLDTHQRWLGYIAYDGLPTVTYVTIN